MMTGPDTALDSGSATAVRRSGPERRCLVTRAVKPKAALIRFVVGPDGTVTPDLAGRLPGRGLWVSARRETIEQAIAKGRFARAAKRTVTVPDGLVDQVEAMLARRCVELLGLARRAGLAVMGYEKARAVLRSGRAALLLAASDSSPDGRGKLRAQGAEVPVFDLLDAGQIGGAFGRDHAVHVALTAGALTDRLRGELVRLAGVRGDGSAVDSETKTAGRRRPTRH